MSADSSPRIDKEKDTAHMHRALALAQAAALMGEVPVGAVIVCNDEVIGEGHNCPIASNDPTAHAEIMALRAAAINRGNYRLNDCTLYVTLEPCPMCAGAIVHSRIKRVVYAAADDKAGAAGSVLQILRHPQLNHICKVDAGLMQHEAQQLLSQFFSEKRAKKLKK